MLYFVLGLAAAAAVLGILLFGKRNSVKSILLKEIPAEETFSKTISRLERDCTDSDLLEGIKWLVDNQNRVLDYCRTAAYEARCVKTKLPADAEGKPRIFGVVQRMVRRNHLLSEG